MGKKESWFRSYSEEVQNIIDGNNDQTDLYVDPVNSKGEKQGKKGALSHKDWLIFKPNRLI